MKRITLVQPENGSVISMSTPAIRQFFQDPDHMGPHCPGENVPYHEEDFSLPKGVVFRWKNPENVLCILQISTNLTFRKCREFPGFKQVTVRNLIPGITYCWRVIAVNGSQSKMQTFSLQEDAPRFLFLDGVTNARDLGGWHGIGGKKIRYGMVYRGAQFEKWDVTKRRISKRGIDTLLDDLGLRTDLDLRGDDVKPFKGFGDRVRHKPFAIYAYATWRNFDIGEQRLGIFSPNERKRIKKIFSLFASAASYPLYMHCQGGGDRTGTIAFLLGAVLGMSLEDLLLEYELSNLSLAQGRSRHSEVMVKFLEKWESYKPGGTIREQVETYLAECGVTDRTLDKIRKLLLEP